MPTEGRLPKLVLAAGVVGVLVLGSRLLPGPAGESRGRQPAQAVPLVRPQRQAGAVVHVAGSVRRPGVYRLAGGARVRDAVRRAGGAARNANLDALNLAARVDDGQQVLVPAREPGGVSPSSGNGVSRAPVSLGSATEAELDTLDGVGPVMARKIVEWRARHGGIGSVDELDEIPGIGPAKLEALRSQLGQ